jgi:hypothetical protein
MPTCYGVDQAYKSLAAYIIASAILFATLGYLLYLLIDLVRDYFVRRRFKDTHRFDNDDMPEPNDLQMAVNYEGKLMQQRASKVESQFNSYNEKLKNKNAGDLLIRKNTLVSAKDD